MNWSRSSSFESCMKAFLSSFFVYWTLERISGTVLISLGFLVRLGDVRRGLVPQCLVRRWLGLVVLSIISGLRSGSRSKPNCEQNHKRRENRIQPTWTGHKDG